MSIERALSEALLAALNSPEGQKALRRAVTSATPNASDDQAYSVAEAAVLSSYTTDVILERIASGDLLARKPRGCREWRIRREDFRAWLTNAGEGAAPAALDPDTVARMMLAGGRKS